MRAGTGKRKHPDLLWRWWASQEADENENSGAENEEKHRKVKKVDFGNPFPESPRGQPGFVQTILKLENQP